MGGDAFQPGAFSDPGFQFGSDGVSSAVSPEREPRWLLKFERTGKTTYLSDIGGEVQGQFYVPAVVDVSHSALLIDLERFAIPSPAATVHISPSALEEFFLDLDDLGQAKVTVSSWDGKTARPIITADMEKSEWGYDGEVTSFRLTEIFRHNPNFPGLQVNLDAWTRAELASGARFRIYPQVWGNAVDVPMFGVLTGPPERFMIAGHNVKTLPSGQDTAARYRDRKGRTYIGVEPAMSLTFPYWQFSAAQGVTTAADLLRLIIRFSGYTPEERDNEGIGRLLAWLSQFGVGGFTNNATPVFGLVAERFQREFMFVMWEQAGKLTGAPIRPTAAPERVMVFGVQLLQLQDPIAEETKYTHFKTRYKYKQGGDGAGWYGVEELGAGQSPYLKALQQRWGFRQFGDPIDVPLHASSIDLADVYSQAAAKKITQRYAQTFHRGQKARYLQLAEFADMRFGTMVALVDPERDYDEKPAILIGREWLTPELIVQTYRTIEPFEVPAKAKQTVSVTVPVPESDGEALLGSCIPTFGPFSGSDSSCWTAPTGPGVFVPGGGPSGEDVIRVLGGSSTTQIKCPCSCVVPSEGTQYVQWGWRATICAGSGSGANAQVTSYLYVYNTPDCSDTPLVYSDGGMSSPGYINPWGTCNHVIVAGGARVILVITINPGTWTVDLFDPILKISSSLPDDSPCQNLHVDVAPC